MLLQEPVGHMAQRAALPKGCSGAGGCECAPFLWEAEEPSGAAAALVGLGGHPTEGSRTLPLPRPWGAAFAELLPASEEGKGLPWAQQRWEQTSVGPEGGARTGIRPGHVPPSALLFRSTNAYGIGSGLCRAVLVEGWSPGAQTIMNYFREQQGFRV